MPVKETSSEAKAIRKLIPLSTLPGPQFKQLCSGIEVEELDKGFPLFSRGDTDNRLVYLLSGQVSLEALGLKVEIISDSDDYAQFALAHQIPRKIDAIANSKIRFLRIDPEVIKNLVATSSNKDSNMIDVDEGVDENGGDWMTRLLQTPVFRLIPAASLQKILISLEEIEVAKGDVIIHQDEFPADYFYIIKKGACALSRKPSPNAKEIKLAELKQGEAFGEASILSGEPRDVTVTAMSEMTLLRLSAEHFLQYIRNPIITYIDLDAIPQEIANGAVIVDIRSPDDYKNDHIENSINIPFITLRMNLKSLDREKKVILVCDEGKLSAAAAFILIKSKFDTCILEGGIKKKLQLAAENVASFDIDETDIEESTSSPAENDLADYTKKTPGQLNEPQIDDNLDDKIALLTAENEKLKRQLVQLQGQNNQLRQEKERINRLYQNLTKNRKI